MGFLKKIFSFLGPAPQEALVLYIKCDYCKTVFKVRIDLKHDLESTYGDTDSYFTLKKEAMDNTCFRLISIDIEFDRHRQVLQQKINGGTFVTEEEYRSYNASR